MKEHYMLISTVLLATAFIPFILLFEKRRPRAREVVLIAVMSAITAVSNLVCAYTVPFHAGTAMVIITGTALGPQAGFLTGALSRFVCNFFMGQGIWTPWEMFAWGLLGALSGVVFQRQELSGALDDRRQDRRNRRTEAVQRLLVPFVCILVSEVAAYLLFLLTREAGEPFMGWRVYVFGVIGILFSVVLQHRRLPSDFITLSVFTFISVFVLYGGIMNLGAFFMTNAVNADATGSLDALKLLYITGAPYDAWHALGASVCVFLAGERMVQKLERIKIKYGMYLKRA